MDQNVLFEKKEYNSINLILRVVCVRLSILNWIGSILNIYYA